MAEAGIPTPVADGSGRRAFLSMGSNLGDRRQRLTEAIDSLGPAVTAVSPVYETDPVGGPDQHRFLNVIQGKRALAQPFKCNDHLRVIHHRRDDPSDAAGVPR